MLCCIGSNAYNVVGRRAAVMERGNDAENDRKGTSEVKYTHAIYICICICIDGTDTTITRGQNRISKNINVQSLRQKKYIK